MTTKKRIFSGIQPSGEVHIGNYLGAIKNWVELIDTYDSIFCIVDYHAMTIKYDTEMFQKNIFNAVVANIACGLDPDRCTLFIQSHVVEHTELTWILNCVAPLAELQRMTQFKEKAQQHQKNINIGLLNYPVLQTADIILYKAELVPVGEDQVQHIELCREIVRKFNAQFGNVFPEPQALLTKTPRILGLDGKNKMSKTLNNYIGILEDKDSIWDKLKTAFTDENRKRKSDPGNPDVCNIFSLHKSFSPPQEQQARDKECRSAQIGCVDCKKILFDNMMEHLHPIQEKAAELKDKPDYVQDILSEGSKRCKTIAASVMDEVRIKTGLR